MPGGDDIDQALVMHIIQANDEVVLEAVSGGCIRRHKVVGWACI
jgi:hypothetical protein